MSSEVVDDVGYVKYNLYRLCSCPGSVLAIGVLLKSSPIVLIFVTWFLPHHVRGEVAG